MTYVILQNAFYEKDIFVGNEDGKRRMGTQVSTRVYRISSSFTEDPSKKGSLHFDCVRSSSSIDCGRYDCLIVASHFSETVVRERFFEVLYRFTNSHQMLDVCFCLSLLFLFMEHEKLTTRKRTTANSHTAPATVTRSNKKWTSPEMNVNLLIDMCNEKYELSQSTVDALIPF